MTTPLPAAIQGLVEALRELADAVDRGDTVRVLAAALARCRAALAAWESRGRLRDDEALVDACYRADPCADDIDAILAVVEAALLGERGP